MDPKDIHFDDFYRIFIGNVHLNYFVELLIRCIVCYAILVVGIRLMGKRMAAQMSRNEMASMVLMAAAIGIPVASPDRGIIPGIIIAAVIVLGERWISSKISKNDALEAKVIGDMRVLACDGYLVMKNIANTRVSRDRIFAELRGSGLKHLGKVKRFYFEADGSFTLIEDEERTFGLSVLPDFDADMLKEQKITAQDVCNVCGMDKPETQEEHYACHNCSSQLFTKAISD